MHFQSTPSQVIPGSDSKSQVCVQHTLLDVPNASISYTYQTLTAKPVFMAEKTVSVMELIAAGHAVALPHDAGVHSYFMLSEESSYDWIP